MFAKRFMMPFLIILVTAGVTLPLSFSKPAAGLSIDYSAYEKDASLEMVIQDGHSRQVSSLSVSPDSKYILSGGYDHLLKIWSVDGKLIRTIDNIDPVHSNAVFSPDGRYILSGQYHRTLKIWDIGGKLIHAIATDSDLVQGVAFSPDGKLIAAAFEDKTVSLWDENGVFLRKFGDPAPYVLPSYDPDGRNFVVFSPDGNYIVSSGENSTVKLWTNQGEPVRTFTGHSGNISCVAFSPDGQYFVSGSVDKTVKLWDRDGKLLKTFGGHSGSVWGVTFSPDGKRIVSCSKDGTIISRDINGRVIGKFTSGSWKLCLAYSPDGRFFVNSDDNKIQLRKADGKLVKDFGGHTRNVESVAVSPDGRYIAGGTERGDIKLWSSDGELKKTLDLRSYGGIASLNFSQDGRSILSGAWAAALILSDLDGKLVKNFRGHKNCLANAVFSPDGKLIASGTGREEPDDRKNSSIESSFKLWSTNGKLLRSIAGHADEVPAVAFSPDGTTIASGSWDGTIKLWDGNGKFIRTVNTDYMTIHRDTFTDIAFSPDGKIIASASFRGNIKLWNPKGGLLKLLSFSGNKLKFSPDGKYLAGGGWNEIKLYNLRDESIRSFWEPGSVHDFKFSPDGKYLVCGLDDGSIKIRNIENEESISLLAVGDRDWFVMDDKGHFDCSDGAKQYVSFVKGFTYYESAQFWNGFFTPGLVARFLGGGRFEGSNIAQYVDFAPSVTIINPSDFTETESDSITVKVLVKPKQNSLGKVFLYHNGRAVDEDTRGVTITEKGEDREFTVSLVEGENTFVGAAFNGDNQAEGRSEKVTVFYKSAKAIKPDMYVLSIGVSDYKDQNIRLKAPAGDANAIGDIFKKVGSSLYGNVNSIVLTDKNASLKNITKAFNEILSKIKTVDTVVIFLAGHGITEKGAYYYLPYDADLTDLENSCITTTDLGDFIRNIPANKVVLFLDTCQSGSATKSLGAIAMARGLEERKIIANLAKARGIGVLSASSETQSAYEIKALGNGILTYGIIQAFNNKKNEITNNKLISISKLLSVVNQLTRDTAYQYLKVEQNPVMYMFGDDFSVGAVK
jgi:WD40 repeat protein